MTVEITPPTSDLTSHVTLLSPHLCLDETQLAFYFQTPLTANGACLWSTSNYSDKKGGRACREVYEADNELSNDNF